MNPSPQDFRSEGLDILAKMRAGAQYQFVVQMRDLRIMMRPLTIGEQMQINNEVLHTLRNLKEGEQHSANESYLLAKAMLEKACTEFGSGRVGPLTDHVLGSMTADEVMYLYRQYLHGVESLNPVLEYMKVEDVQELVDRVKKKESELTGLSTLQLLSLARYFITQSD